MSVTTIVVFLIYILGIYVDQSIIVEKSGKLILQFKSNLAKRFKIEDVGLATGLLGYRIERVREHHVLKISQNQYIPEIVDE